MEKGQKNYEDTRDYEREYLKLDFTNDFLFCKIMSSELELCRELLEVILDVPIKEVRLAESQKSITITGDGKGVRFDVYLNDDNETVYDLEMQRRVYKDIPKRTRYYRGMIDLNIIEKGKKYSDLKKTIIIFICKTDPYDKELYRYTFANMCKEVPELLMGDEAEMVFLNIKGKRGEVSEELKNFLTYLNEGVPKGKLCNRIEEAVKRAREHKEWRLEYMTLMMRDAENREEGREEGRIETLYRLIKKGRLTLEEGAEEMSCTVEEFSMLIQEESNKYNVD